jgi:biopolymer transport protein TolQ
MDSTEIVANGVAAVSGDITLWSMFWQAAFVVKLVMLGLLGASIWCWGIIIDKSFLYARTQKAMDRFEDVFWSGQSLDELYLALKDRETENMAALFMAAMGEWKRSIQASAASFMNLTQRIDKVLDVTIQREVGRLESKLLVLATIGSASPFIGLFGTVWGIMTAFRSIAASKNTSLAVVAPGIAEALFATAIGLFAAIPAVIAYNVLQSRAAKQQARLEGFADEFSTILSRHIDEHIQG